MNIFLPCGKCGQQIGFSMAKRVVSEERKNMTLQITQLQGNYDHAFCGCGNKISFETIPVIRFEESCENGKLRLVRS